MVVVVICKSQSIVRSHKDLQPLKRGSRERMDVRTCASNVIIPRVCMQKETATSRKP